MSTKIWRPWVKETSMEATKKDGRFQPYARHPRGYQPHPLHQYLNTFKHPVRLYWTKAAYDYMYEAGEKLLRNFPVQATIQVIEESDSSDDEDDEEEDELHEEQMIKQDKKVTSP